VCLAVLKVGMSPAVPLPMLSDRRSFVVIIGVDPHKRTHTASALDPGTHRVLATLQIDATLAGYRQLARWATRFESRRWAVENARGLGRHLAQPSASRSGERRAGRGQRRRSTQRARKRKAITSNAPDAESGASE
jgi:transposase